MLPLKYGIVRVEASTRVQTLLRQAMLFEPSFGRSAAPGYSPHPSPRSLWNSATWTSSISWNPTMSMSRLSRIRTDLPIRSTLLSHPDPGSGVAVPEQIERGHPQLRGLPTLLTL